MSYGNNTLICLAFTIIYFLIFPTTPVYAQTWVQMDDTNPTIGYRGIWYQGPCGGCLDADAVNVYNTSWHEARPRDSSGNTGIDFQYYGSSLLVTGLLNNQDPDWASAVTITLDGTSSSYFYASTKDGTITSGAGVFHRDDLEVGQHTLRIDIQANTGFYLDFIAYLSSPPPAAPNDSSGSGSSSSSSSSSPNPQNLGSSSLIIASGSGTATVVRSPSAATPSGTTTSFNPATVLLVNATLSVSTSTDISGRTVLVPITPTDSQSDAERNPPVDTSSAYGTSKSGVSPGVAGAIGAVVAIFGAILILALAFCFRRRQRQLNKERGAPEPYLMVASSSSHGATISSIPTTSLQHAPITPIASNGLYRDQSIAHGPDARNSPQTPNFLSPTTPLQYPYLLPLDPFARNDTSGLQDPHAMSPQPSASRAFALQNNENREGSPFPPRRTTARRGRRLKEPLDFPISTPRTPGSQGLGVIHLDLGSAVITRVGGELERGSVEDDEESLLVVRPPSLSHPAPPAYSPPRVIRNLGPEDL